ncbi:hypothetical protein ACC848_44760, partial [Rhizobium johnstonii]
RDLDFTRLDADHFAKIPDISIDYAIMEKTSKAAFVPSPFKCSDMGSWDAVWKSGSRLAFETALLAAFSTSGAYSCSS